MKHFIILISMMFFLTVSCSTRMKPNKLSCNDENSLLWKISGNGLQYDSYLFGTMHSVGRTFLDSIEGFRKAFNVAKQIAVECDLFALDSIRATSKPTIRDYVFMPADTTYAMLYNRNDFRFVDSMLTKYTQEYFKYKPVFWTNLLGRTSVFSNSPTQSDCLDRFILLLGYQNYKKIYFMETLEDIGQKWVQYDSLGYTMDLYNQAKDLQRTLKYPDSLRSFYNKIEVSYRKQELNHLSMDYMCEQANLKNEPDFVLNYFKETELSLVVTRNKEWMKVLIPMIKKGPSLIAVGAAHLPGNDGLIALLRELGYSVEPV